MCRARWPDTITRVADRDDLLASDEVLHRAGRQCGVLTDDARLIRDGSNALYQLPGGIVARVGRPGGERTAQREVRISRWLSGNGMSVVEARVDVDQSVVIGGRPVTWWTLLPPHRPATPVELVRALRALHMITIPPAEVGLELFDPFTGLDSRITRSPVLSTEDRDWLSGNLTRLRTAYKQLSISGSLCVIHGDAWQGNVAVPDSGPPILLDLEHVGLGWPEWDLIPVAVDYRDFGRIEETEYRDFVDSYGGYDVTAWDGFRVLADIQELRWLSFVLAKAPDDPEASIEVRHRIACLRGEIPRPWTWRAF